MGSPPFPSTLMVCVSFCGVCVNACVGLCVSGPSLQAQGLTVGQHAFLALSDARATVTRTEAWATLEAFEGHPVRVGEGLVNPGCTCC